MRYARELRPGSTGCLPLARLRSVREESHHPAHLLSHQAGLPAFPDEASRIAFDDRETLVDLLAAAAPVHPSGTAVAEHALTYGHLLDETLRRAIALSMATFYTTSTGPTASSTNTSAPTCGRPHPTRRIRSRPCARPPHHWTLGFQSSEEDGRTEVAMGGAGGGSGWTESAARYGAAYVTRGLGSHARGDAIWQAIHALARPR